MASTFGDTEADREEKEQAERVHRLVLCAERYMLSVKRLGEESGYNRLTYFEAPILKMPTAEMQREAFERWQELNNAGQKLTAAIRASSSVTSNNSPGES